MNFKNNKLFFIPSFFIFLSAFLLKLPGVIFPPTDYFYTPLERTEIFSIFGIFFGLIPAGITFSSLGIYGIPLILLYTLDFALMYPRAILSLFKYNPGILVQGLSVYIAKVFLNPTRQLIIGRLFVATITSFAPLALWWLFSKSNRKTAAIPSTILFLTSPFLVEQSYNLLPDPIGLMFFTFVLLIMLGQEQLSSHRIFIGSIFLGLALAAKFIYVAFLPTAFLVFLLNRINNPRNLLFNLFRNILIFMAGLALVIFIFVPFIWTAPLPLAKNLLGTLKQYYGNQTCWKFVIFEVFPLFINWFGLPFFVIGLFSSFFVLNKKTAIFFLMSFFSFLLPLGNANFIAEKYALPLLPHMCIYAGIGMDVVMSILKRQFKLIVIAVVVGIISISNLAGVVKKFKITHNNTNNLDCINWIKKNIPSGSNIAILESLDYFFIPSENTLKQWINNLSNSYDNMVEERLRDLFLIAGTEFSNLDSDNPLVPKIFGALEQQKLFVYKTLLWYFRNVEKPKLNYNLFLYLPAKDYKLGIISSKKEEVLRLFLEGKIDLFVSSDYLSLPFLYTIKYFNRYPEETYYLYLHKSKK